MSGPIRNKTTLVADFLHHVIPLTNVERFIVSTPVFNRLHWVKQNSTAYLTYPSLTHSRFGHSLGAAHIGTQMYCAAIANAAPQVRLDFIRSLSNIVRRVNLLRRGVPDGHERLAGLQEQRMPELLRAFVLSTPLLTKAVPLELSNDEQVAFCVGLQALRIAALVHDLGHPPFSHVTEYAVKSLYQDDLVINGKSGHAVALRKLNAEGTAQDKQPHETLTLNLFEAIRRQAQSTAASAPFPRVEEYVGACVCLTIAGAILAGGQFITTEIDQQIEPSERLALRGIQSIEDGAIDADRLDYVQRDVLLSGIRGDGFRSDRLVSLMKLVYDEPTKLESDKYLAKFGKPVPSGKTVPRFLPSTRSIRSLGEFFEWKSELYRTVIYHHHVVRTDGLFKELIRQISHEVIESAEKNTDGVVDLEDKVLTSRPEDIHWLWSVYHDSHDGTSAQMNLYLQLDDSWLMSIIRQKYFALKSRIESTQMLEAGVSAEVTSAPLSTKEIVTFKRLEEIVASEKNYIALVKRHED